jgi:hypothetical protein
MMHMKDRMNNLDSILVALQVGSTILVDTPTCLGNREAFNRKEKWGCHCGEPGRAAAG